MKTQTLHPHLHCQSSPSAPPETSEHRWIEVRQGSPLTNFVPFRFCRGCDREERADGTVRPGYAPAACLPNQPEAGTSWGKS